MMPDYALLHNLYWDSKDDVCVLGFDVAPASLPNNFKFISMGVQSQYGTVWTDPIRKFFSNSKDEYFYLLLDDMFIVNYVNVELLKKILDEVKNIKYDKIILDGMTDEMCRGIPHTKSTILMDSDVNYRTTLHNSIWNREYFLKLLKHGYNIWDFEIKNMQESKSDKSSILYPKEYNDNQTPIFKVINVITKGAFSTLTYELNKHKATDYAKTILEKYM
jgi:hypothetical protein